VQAMPRGSRAEKRRRRDNMKNANLAKMATLAGLSMAASVQASVLTFSFGGGDGTAVPQEYGDRITSTTMGSFSYGDTFGFTPNVLASYDGAGGVNHWSADYGDLRGVAYTEAEGGNVFRLTLAADAGWQVSVHGFDLGGWVNTDYTINAVRVFAGELGSLTAAFEDTSVLVRGSSVDNDGNRHTTFDFANPIVGSVVVIEFDSSNLGGAGDNVGIDNVAFGQVVPAPATLGVLLLSGVLGRSTRRR
jgi:hypothetical protein